MSDLTPVLHLINGEFYAGGERVQDLLAMRLPELGYEVTFVCLKEGVFDEMRQSKNTRLISLPMRSKFDYGHIFKLANIIREGGYQLVHSHTRRAALIGQIAAAITGVPMVHHVHSPSDQDTEHGWRNRINSLAERLSLIRVAKLIPVSGSLANYLYKHGYKQDRVVTVWNGVPVQEQARRERADGEALVIGMVALFRPRKGVEVLIDAIAQLRNEGHDVKLHAVGPFETEDYASHVRAKVDQLGLTDAIHWTGFTDNVPAEFPKMHVFVLPSLFGEGMPMVLLEAMSAGLPVVSTRVEGIPEVVREGQDGLLVEAGNSRQLAEALRKIATDEADCVAMGNSGRQRHNEHFSDLAMASGVARVYQEILQK